MELIFTTILKFYDLNWQVHSSDLKILQAAISLHALVPLAMLGMALVLQVALRSLIPVAPITHVSMASVR